MRERPIIMTAEEVRAILAGCKTQTRRVVRSNSGPAPSYVSAVPMNSVAGVHWWSEPGGWIRCPYGMVGEKLWVRETFALESNCGYGGSGEYPPPYNDGRPIRWHEDEAWGQWWQQPHYRATDPEPHLVGEDRDYSSEDDLTRWRSPIHMPRWASRLTLEVTDVRVQRLQEISEEDAKSEGVEREFRVSAMATDGSPDYSIPLSYRGGFVNAWQRVNTERGYSWSSNLWVWAISHEDET